MPQSLGTPEYYLLVDIRLGINHRESVKSIKVDIASMHQSSRYSPIFIKVQSNSYWS